MVPHENLWSASIMFIERKNKDVYRGNKMNAFGVIQHGLEGIFNYVCKKENRFGFDFHLGPWISHILKKQCWSHPWAEKLHEEFWSVLKPFGLFILIRCVYKECLFLFPFLCKQARREKRGAEGGIERPVRRGSDSPIQSVQPREIDCFLNRLLSSLCRSQWCGYIS